MKHPTKCVHGILLTMFCRRCWDEAGRTRTTNPSPTLAELLTPEEAKIYLRHFCKGHHFRCPVPRSLDYLVGRPNEERCIYNFEREELVEPPQSAKVCHWLYDLWQRAQEGKK